MGTAEGGRPAITLQRTLQRETSSIQLQLFVAADGDPVLTFVDQAGRPRYKIPR
jgi:hypothetical protein